MAPEPAQPAEAWLNDPASMESGEPAQPAESPEALGPLWRKVQKVHSDAMANDWPVADYRAGMMATLAATTARPTERTEREELARVLRWFGLDQHADNIAAGESVPIPSYVALSLIAARPTERGAVEVSELSALRSEFVDFARYLRNAPANPLDEKREVSVRMILAVADALPANDQAAEVEAIARIIDPAAWRCYDATLLPFQENRGAHEGESWHVRAYQAGCRSADDARRWWLETADDSEPHTICLFRESLTKAKAIAALATQPATGRAMGGEDGMREALESIANRQRDLFAGPTDHGLWCQRTARAALQNGGE